MLASCNYSIGSLFALSKSRQNSRTVTSLYTPVDVGVV